MNLRSSFSLIACQIAAGLLIACGGGSSSPPTPPVNAPDVSFSPSSLSFGNQNVNTTSSTQTVVLSNTGNAALSISGIAINGTNPADFAQTNNCGTSLSAGANCTFNLSFTPTASGSRSASLAVTDNASGSPQSVALSGTGAAPAVTLSSSSVSFSNQNVGTTSAAQTVKLSNSGNAGLTLTTIAISGANAGDFSQANNCGATLAAGADCNLNISFTPTAAGSRAATLDLTDNAAGSPQSITLAGTGVIPIVVNVAPSSASVQTGGTQQFTATISGSSNTAVTWSVNGTTGGNATVGTITAGGLYTAPAAVPNPASVTVTATSAADGTSSGSSSVTITGVPGASVSSNNVSFGGVAVGYTSPAQAIEVSSTGTGPLAISSIGLSGSSDFRQYNNCPVGGTLSSGASCMINVMLHPTQSTPAETATLTIADNATGGTQTALLAGAGYSEIMSVTPVTVTVDTNDTVPFLQRLTGVANTAVTWSVNGIPGGNYTVGTITGGGVYTAPSSVPSPNTVTVSVTSQAAPSLTANATVTLQPAAVAVLVSPASASVAAGATETLTANIINGGGNTAVTWTVDGVANGNSSVGTITSTDSNEDAVTYTAPATPPSSPVTIVATSSADSSKSASLSLTIASGSALTITGVDKSTLQPFNLLTLSGSGFNPQATPQVTFSDASGYSVTVSPSVVNANSLAVAVPPYFDVSSGTLAAGTVNLQVSETIDGSQATSNTYTGFQIQNLPTLTAPAGSITLALLNSLQQFQASLQSYLNYTNPGSSLNTLEMTSALANANSSLNTFIANVYNVVHNPTNTFTLGMVSGKMLTIGENELATSDRMLAGMLAAQAAAGYVDAPEAGSQASGASDILATLTAQATEQQTASDGYVQQSLWGNAVAQAFDTAFTVVGGAAAVGVGVGALLLGPEAVAMTAAAVGGYMLYATVVSSGGLTAIGASFGEGSAYGRALVQEGVKLADDYMKDALTSTVVSTTFGETAGNLFDIVTNANELHHALVNAPPLNGAPSTASMYTLNVSTTGAGSGTLVSSPGGIVCGNQSFSCTASYPAGTTVYLSSQATAGSSLSSYGGNCSGINCSVTMNSDQSITADFETIPTPANAITFTGTATGTVTDEGQGGCNGGAGGSASLSGNATLVAVPLASGGYSYSGTVTLSEGFGICDDYSGTYSFSGTVDSLSGGSTAFYFGSAFANGSFTGGNTFTGTWSFSVNVGPDVASGSLNLTAP